MELKGTLLQAGEATTLNEGATDEVTFATTNSAAVTLSYPSATAVLIGGEHGGDASKLVTFDTSGATTATKTTIAASQTTDRTLTLPDATDILMGRATTDTMTNKTHTAPLLTAGSNFDVTGAGSVNLFASLGANTLTIGGATSTVDFPGTVSFSGTTATFTDPNITVNNGGNQAAADDVAGITVSMSDATDVALIYEDALTSKWKIGEVGSEVEVATVSGAQTFTNKTHTSPKITDAGAGDLVITSSDGALSADRTLSIDVNNADRTLDLSSNFTVGAGGNITLNSVGPSSSVTVPASGTLATTTSTTLQTAYDNSTDPATITTNSTDGNFTIAGDQAMDITADEGLNINQGTPGANDAIGITYTGSGDAINIGIASGTGGGIDLTMSGTATGAPVSVVVSNASSSANLISASTSGSGSILVGSQTNTSGNGVEMSLTNASNAGTGILMTHAGTGRGILVQANGTGVGVEVNSDASVTSAGVLVDHDGTGAGVSIDLASGNTADAIEITHAGTGAGLDLDHTGSSGVGINLDVTGGSNANTALAIRHQNSAASTIDMEGATSGTLGHFVPATITSYDITWPNAIGAVGQNIQIQSISSGNATLTWAAGGGGGGGALNWFETAGNAPIADEENGEKVYIYQTVLQQKLTAWVKVPSSYTAGNQIQMVIAHYTPGTSSDNMRMQTTATLIRSGTDAITSTTNQETDDVQTALSATANRLELATLDLTDGSGEINSVAVSGGDLIKVELVRIDSASAETTEDVKFVPSGTEVTFA